MFIRLLGPFQVDDGGGRPVPVPGARGRTLLARLALQAGRPVPVPALIDALWPAGPPRSARNSLQTYVARLRAVLGRADLIILEPAGYRLAVEPAGVDAHRFEDLLRVPGAEPEALALWRGSPLPEFPDEPFRGWSVRLADARRAALVRLADAAAGATAGAGLGGVDGRWGRELAAEVDADPCWEPGVLALARVLAGDGRRGDAAALLRRHADAVVDRLGMDPSADVKRVQVALLRGDDPGPGGQPSPAVAAPAGPDAQAGPVPLRRAPRVPLRFSSFVGRDREQAELARLLTGPGLVCVVGPGGVGKTRLVAETVRAGSRVAWVDAADVRGRDDFRQAVAVGVGARLGPRDDPLAAIAAAARRDRPIVVLDNCEHLLDAAAEMVEALLPAAVRIVVTSQERLRVDGERLLSVPPLSADAGARLFLDRAGAAAADADPADVAEIVRGLDALPLAIELAATQAAGLGVAQLRDRLGDRLDLLTRGGRTSAPRHRTLRAVVDWSAGLLDPAGRALLIRLAAFAGGFTVPLAEAVAAATPDERRRVAATLAHLVDRSLVVRHGPRRYRLLETVRAYAAEQLAGSPDGPATCHRHAEAMVMAAEELAVRMHGPEQAEAVREIDALLPDLRRARLTGGTDVAARLAAAMFRYGYHCQHYEVLAWGHDAAGDRRALPSAATHAWGRGDLALARSLATRALHGGAEESDPGTAAAHEVLGDVALVGCDSDTALRHYRAMTACSYPAVAASGHIGAALVLAWTGDTGAGLRTARTGLALAERCGNPSARAEARYGLGEVLGDADPDRALTLLAEAAALAATVDDRLFRGAAETAAAAVASRHGDPAPALRDFRDVLELWRRTGNDTLQATALRNLLVLLARVGADEAAAVLDAALPPAAVYPAEAARLDRARAAIAGRLGPDRLAALRQRGAGLSPAQVSEVALGAVDAALDRLTGRPSHSAPAGPAPVTGRRYG